MPLQPIHNEKELLLLVTQGDEKAFARLFYAYHNHLGEFVLLLTGSAQLTEEIIQDIFVKVWESRATLSDIEKFTAWLFILTRNYTLNSLRRIANDQKRQKQYGQYISREAATGPSTGSANEYELLIGQAVAQLPPQQQKVYLLRTQEELSYAEIAERMGLSRESVKKYLQWASRSVCDYVKVHATLIETLVAISFFCS